MKIGVLGGVKPRGGNAALRGTFSDFWKTKKVFGKL